MILSYATLSESSPEGFNQLPAIHCTSSVVTAKLTITYIISKSLALCSEVRKFFYTDERSGFGAGKELKNCIDYEPQAKFN